MEFTPHLLKRMADRRLTEVDLRRMLENAIGLQKDIVDGRWVIQTRHRRRPGQKSVRTRRVEPGLVIDLARGGRPIGIEITAPGKLSLAGLNRLLRKLGFGPVTREDLAPLLAA